VDLGWLEFYVAGGAATVMRVAPGGMTAAELAGRVLGELRGRHVAEAFWKVGPGYSPEGAGQALLDLGASVDRTIDICAYPLDGPVPEWPLPGDVTARPVRTREDVACYERASCAAWGYPPPSDADVDRAFAGLAPGCFTGYWNETPAGAGGYTLAGPVARLWGAAVVPVFRGRGVYRALVRARLAHAAAGGGDPRAGPCRAPLSCQGPTIEDQVRLRWNEPLLRPSVPLASSPGKRPPRRARCGHRDRHHALP